MPSRRTWGSLTKANRDKITAQAERDYGLSRKQVRDRYNRGTFSPFARDPLKRVPTEFRRQAIRTPTGQVTVDWPAAARANMRAQLGDYYKWNDKEVARNLSHANETVLRAISMATEDDLVSIAHIQNPLEAVDLPFGLSITDIGYFTEGKDGRMEWINIFWYH